ncbi:MAG TPA: DUF3500 domain-containing protein, partial [Vicinamibacterales bacterium]
MMSQGRIALVATYAAVAVVAVALPHVGSGQQPLTKEQRAEQFRQRSVAAEKEGLASAFTGIATPAGLESGLFAIRSTGVSTDPVVKAAQSFLAALSAPQRQASTFAADDIEWRKWMNQDFYVRQGVSLLDLSEAQREIALGLLRASLSAKGLKQTRDIMRLNYTLGELNENDFDRYGEWRYHITIMGTPSSREPWGWQFDGHHAIINYFVLGDQVVMTPFFAGSEPVVAESGKFKGTAVLQDEEAAGLAMIRALTDEQRRKAIIKVSKTGNENLTEAFKDNVVLDYAGIPVKDLDAQQRARVLDLMRLYIRNMDDGHARVKMEEVSRHIDRTWLAWIGGTEPGSVFYYRIHSPVVLIEFDHQVPANLRQYAKDPTVPNRRHIHVVVRTPNRNDYGKDLLRQH